jgi:stearoyl-CoA desaturase (Delta-9 desaturase)
LESISVNTPIPKIIDNKISRLAQKRHFVRLWLIPNLLAICLLPVFGFPTWNEVGLFLTGWLITSIGISVGFHRLFTHKSFQTNWLVETGLAISGMMAGGGSLLSWVSIHRRHHEKSDQEGDPHSPIVNSLIEGKHYHSKLLGFLHAHTGWMIAHEYPNPAFYAKDLLKKPHLVMVSKRYHLWVALGFILPGIANLLFEHSWIALLRGLYFGGLLRYVVTHHFISTIDSVCHLVGTRRYPTSDNSRNVWWLALPTAGESWHNNHHGEQLSAYFGRKWYELDIGGAFVFLLKKLGLAQKVVSPHGITDKCVSAEPREK